MTRLPPPEDFDIIGGRPPARDQLAGLGLFEQRPVEECEAELRRDFQHAEAADAVDAAPDIDGSGLPSKAEREAAIERLKAYVLPSLVTLADGRVNLPLEKAGVTAADARRIADRSTDAALLGSSQRAWSWVGPWMTHLGRTGVLPAFVTAEGVPVKRRVPNTVREKSHGNAHQVYLSPRDQRARGAA